MNKLEQDELVRMDIKARFFRGLGDSLRLAILEHLVKVGEASVGELCEALGVKQPRLSNHLACLRDCYLVQARQEGVQVFYSVKDERVKALLRDADRVLADTHERVYKCTRI